MDAVDADAEALAAARAAGGGPRYRHADVRDTELPGGHYDFISCVASLHHMEFATVTRLRQALAPGGVPAVLGLYPVRTVADALWSVPAVALNTAHRALSRRRPGPADVPVPLVWPPPLGYGETRAEAARLLPGATLRRLVLWRYLLVYREPPVPSRG
ncbi:class I SAM-dependent methyltransferase [Streptomyces zingiberis]|uniref:class I SAM-dependent methyltransferase n=1 Tax=Streptomyces zingiberis TaxID=2053010 RepID=UPI002892A080|nr:class I SAM-dependent methyltransferase [Streptomyces zingiberis]